MNTSQDKKVAFELIDGIILVPGEIKNVFGYFAIDTGATQTVLNKTYINSTTNIVEKKAITFDNSTQSSGISMKDTESISVSGEKIELNHVHIMGMDYVEVPLRKTKPALSFLGSIGADIFGVGRLIIDYPRKQVIFGATKIPENAKMIKLSFASKLPIAELKIQQKIYHFVLDTGANQFVMNQATAPMETICSSSDIDAPQNIKTLEFAGKKYNNIHGIVTDLSPLRKKLHVDVDGIIGYQLLKEYVCCFDYGSELLYLAQEY